MAWLSKLWNTFRMTRLQSELDEELRHHLELRTRDLQKSGMPGTAARTEAASRFGNFTFEKEKTREMDIFTSLETIGKDLRYALRQLARNPVFAAVAVLSLALGIGANTALFSIFNAVLLRSLPVRNPDELVILTNPDASGAGIGSSSGERALLTYAEYEQLRDRSATMAGLCASDSSLNHWTLRIAGGSQEEATGRLVSESYFSVLGVEPFIGRVFTQADVASVGSDPYAVISYDYWQRRFGGKANVLGMPIQLYSAALTVIGVAAPNFHGETVGENPDIWAPMMMEPLVKPGRDWIHEDLSKSIDKVMWLHVFGRLKPGMTVMKAQAEMNILFKNILEEGYPRTLSADDRKELLDQRIKIRSARNGAFGKRNEFSQQLLVLLVVAGLVLLIACANVANLLLARATARYKEVGIRLSLGAARGRLLRQFITESLLLAGLGGVTGIVLALVAARGLLLLLSETEQPLQLSNAFDWRVLLFTFSMTLLTGILFGLAPAFRNTRVDVSQSLKESGRSVTDTGMRMTVAKCLVAVQVALSLLLVAGAGLFLRTLWNLESVAVGYAKENLLAIRVDAVTAGYKDAQRPTLYNEVADRLRALPGVRSVAYSENGLFGGTESADPVDVEGYIHKNKDNMNARFDQIGPGYFSAIGVPLLLGREINVRDTAGALRVCVINEAFAKRFFAGRNPIGKHVADTYGGSRLTMEVVGVAKDVKDHRLRGDVPPRFYVPVAQGDGGIAPNVYFEVRTTGDANRALNSLRRSILQVNANLQILMARTVDSLIDSQNRLPRLIAQLCSIFGAIALVLAATGLYGVLSYSIARRTNEIGIRMALGADKGSVIGMVLRETSIMIVLGMAAGIGATFGLTRLIANRLYGLSAMDPLTICAALGILGAVALAASYIPALRAARVSPVAALRHE
ncbi:MAG: ABC transporter permease [Acidobacteriaceae bacterium]|nr:ABC transporter permease [Acidobacteriaceae bacterium]